MKTTTVFAFLRLALMCAAVTSCVLPFRTAQAAQFIPLGYETLPEGVSGDGSFAVGSSRSSYDALRWSGSGQVLNLGQLPGGCSSNAVAASRSGAVVVGNTSFCNDTGEAFRWTENAGMQGLGTLPGDTLSGATDVSADGSVIVGHSAIRTDPAHSFKAFRWTDGAGMVGLGTLPGDTTSAAFGVSADGLAVVGSSVHLNPSVVYEAFLWTEAGGMQGLGALPGNTGSEAFDISADGSTVVGDSGSIFGGGDFQAFRWTAGTGMLGLGRLPGLPWSIASGVSGDGSVVVGHGANGRNQDDEAFIWDETNGMRRLKDVLTAEGLDLTGWRLRLARGVSDDGTVIAGWGFNPSGQEEGWIARLNVVPEPTTFALLIAGCVGISLLPRKSVKY